MLHARILRASYINIRSTSSSETPSPSIVKPFVRADSWFAICCATSSLPPLLRYSVIPVALKEWLPILVHTSAVALKMPPFRNTPDAAVLPERCSESTGYD